MIQTLHMPEKIVQGAGAFHQLMNVSTQLRMDHLFVMISQRSVEEMKAITLLAKKEKVKVTFYHKKRGEPTTKDVALSVNNFIISRADGIVAIGGGSILDLAKATAVLAKNEGLTVENLQNKEIISRFPLIAVSTTAGTGSEVTKVSVITDTEKQIKYNPGHENMIPDVAILDPELSIGLPRQITAQTGMDAFAHALEAFVSTKATKWTDMFAVEAIQSIGENLPFVYDNLGDVEAREKMLYASSLAGIAFSNASTNLAHATARALGTKLNIPHGLSVAMMLPPVIEFSMQSAIDRYKYVASLLKVNDLVHFVHLLNIKFNLYRDARQLIKIDKLEQLIPTLVTDALSGNGILTNRQVPTKEDIEQVFQKMIINIQEEL